VIGRVVGGILYRGLACSEVIVEVSLTERMCKVLCVEVTLADYHTFCSRESFDRFVQNSDWKFRLSFNAKNVNRNLNL